MQATVKKRIFLSILLLLLLRYAPIFQFYAAVRSYGDIELLRPTESASFVGSMDDMAQFRHMGESGLHTAPEEEAESPLGFSEDDEKEGSITNLSELGNWTNYNGIIFGDADIYESYSGGGLAVGGSLSFNANFTSGSTYTTEYDPTIHIGEYQNEQGFPALLLGGNSLSITPSVTTLDVYGGPVAMSSELLEYNSGLDTGLTPRDGSRYGPAEQALLDEWFHYQRKMAAAASQLMLVANDISIDITELSNGSYLDAGPETYQNQYFQVNGQVYEKALFVTVHTGSEVNFGQWWPIHSIISMDVNWALDYDLLVFNFPEAVNVTFNSSSFQIENLQHWSTTVDAWIGERGTAERLALAEKVVYNFPNAGSIEASQSLIQGTILAPNATFTGIGLGGNGHIYGHIVANHFVVQGNFTIHAFSLTHWVYDIVEEAISEKTETGSILLRHYLYFREEPTHIRLSGGQFLLEQDGDYYNGNGGFTDNLEEAAFFSTTPDSYTVIRDVPLGDYTLTKVKTPEGFRLNDSDPDIPETYYQSPVSVTAEGQVATALRYTEPEFIDLYFKSVDADTLEGLPGTSFTIIREADEYENSTMGGTYISGEDGLFVSHHVPVGSYRLLEVAPKARHESLEQGEFRFTVFWNAETSALAVQSPDGRLLSATQDTPLEIVSPSGVENTALIVKYTRDADHPEELHPLPGTEFSLYRYAEDADSWRLETQNLIGADINIVTNEMGYFRVDHLPQGIYRIVETKPTPGYARANDYRDNAHPDIFPDGFADEFSLASAPSFHTAYILGKALEVDITAISLGALFEEPLPLAGTALKLEYLLSDGHTWEELVYRAETGPDGSCRFDGLTVGAYRLTQLDAATGYQTLEPAEILFNVVFDESGTVSINVEYNGVAAGAGTAPVWLSAEGELCIFMENQAITTSFVLYKIDGDFTVGADPNGMPTYQVTYLEGAEFRLRRRADTRSKWTDYGPAFHSLYQYTNEGPALDSYGNHIAAAVFPPGLLYGDYQLVELSPPDGYQPNSDIQVTFDDGGTGIQLHRFTVTEHMAENNDTATYTAANYTVQHTATLLFRTVESSGHSTPIPGIEFSLYHCGEAHTHNPQLTENSCWAKATPINVTSGRNGLVQFDNLTTGEYLLHLSQVPGGYRLPGTTWLVTVDAAIDTIVLEPVSSAPAYSFIQTGYEDPLWLLPVRRQLALPVTGGTGAKDFLITGLFLVGIAIALLAMTKRRHKM